MNRTTKYILPLVLPYKYKDSGLTALLAPKDADDLESIYVEYTDNSLLDISGYDGVFIDKNNKKHIKFNIPDYYKEDFNYFIVGQYTKMSKEAKSIIIAWLPGEEQLEMAEKLTATQEAKEKLSEELATDKNEYLNMLSIIDKLGEVESFDINKEFINLMH